MSSIVPSVNSAFRLVKPLPKPEMEPVAIEPPTNPHGYTWRTYTESHIRQSLCLDIRKRNFLLTAIKRFDEELEVYGVLNSPQKYNHYIFLTKQKNIMIERLKKIKYKLDIHTDYQLYHKFKL
jgi:hypothetical protein